MCKSRRKEKLFSTGNKICIRNESYANLNNEFLNEIYSNKERYSLDKARKEDESGKGPRPLVIIWSNKYSNKVIAIPETTKYREPDKTPLFISPESTQKYWQYNVLILDKKDVVIYKNHIWYKFKKDVINEFIESWKDVGLKVSYNYLKSKINEYEAEVRKEIIKEQEEKIKELEKNIVNV